MHFSRPALIHNPVGGSARVAMREALTQELQRRNFQVQEYATGPELNSARTLAEHAIANGADLLIAMGGDGTALEVAEAAMAAGLPFAAYQGGTSNQFASSFYPRLPAFDFCHMLVEGQTQPIDVLEIELEHNGKKETRRALVGICTGQIAEAITGAPRFWKRIFGPLVYFYRVALCCLRLKPQEIRFKTTTKEWSETLSTTLVLNVDKTPLVPLVPSCNASDGLMDVINLQAKSLAEILRVGFWTLLQRPYKAKQLRRTRVESISIEAKTPMHLNIDGEPAVAQKLKIRVLKGALSMIVSP